MGGPVNPADLSTLILSNAPQEPCGYGQQAGLLALRMKAAGYPVAIQAFHGQHGSVAEWNGITVYPASYSSRSRHFGLDLTAEYMTDCKADLLLTLTDAWVFDPTKLAKFHVAHWLPIDAAMPGCEPWTQVGDPDLSTLSVSGAIPVAMSRFGQQQLQAAGYPALYAPHGVDCQVFAPRDDADTIRSAFGFGDEFVVVMNAANVDLYRKAFIPQFLAFSKFHERHPNSRLLCWTLPDGRPQGLNLGRWAKRLGIFDAIEFPPSEERYIAGGYSPQWLASCLYPLGNVFLGATRAEGFGIPIVEAAACGLPTIATDFSAMTETGAGGVLVPGHPFETPLHNAFWATPSIAHIEAALERLWQAREDGELPAWRARARQHALTYDCDRVFGEYWVPALAEIGHRIDGPTVAERADAHGRALTEFIARSEDVWREIDRLDAEPEGYHPNRMSVELRQAERAAWNTYRDTKPAASATEVHLPGTGQDQ
jgi:hypothetical protein